MRANREAFALFRFRPRVLRDVSAVETTTSLLGREIPIPLVLAPTGFTRIVDPAGRAGGRLGGSAGSGVPYTLSTLSTRRRLRRWPRPMAKVAAGSRSTSGRTRALLRDMVHRAAAAGYEALVITVDTANLGRPRRDVRRGSNCRRSSGWTPSSTGWLHPSWTWRFVLAESIRFANVGDVGGRCGRPGGDLGGQPGRPPSPPSSTLACRGMQCPPGSGRLWKGPIVIKGIQSVDDARVAADAGVEAIALSNHGGRQLDDAPAAARPRRPGRR